MQRSEGMTRARDGAEIFTRRWMPDGAVKATVALLQASASTPGATSGSPSASRAAATWCRRSIREGTAGRPDAAPTDGSSRCCATSTSFLDRERAQSDTKKLFLYEQSLGGLFALTYALERQPALAGVVASAPALHTSLRV